MSVAYNLDFCDRHYNPSNARFLSEDPKGFKGKDSNLYRYVRNNPLKYIDPNGKSHQLPDIGGGAEEYNLKMEFAMCISTVQQSLAYSTSLCSVACVGSGIGMSGCISAVQTLGAALGSTGAAVCAINYAMKFNRSQQAYAPGTSLMDSLNVIKNDMTDLGFDLTESGLDALRSILGRK